LRPAPAGGAAAEKTITILHESSFIKPFDEYVREHARPGLRGKETGIKVVYEVTSCRQPADADQHDCRDRLGRRHHDERPAAGDPVQQTNISTSATSPTRSARRKAAGTTAGKEAVVVEGKWKAIPFANIGQLMNWRTDWFAEVGVKKFPGGPGKSSTKSARS